MFKNWTCLKRFRKSNKAGLYLNFMETNTNAAIIVTLL